MCSSSYTPYRITQLRKNPPVAVILWRHLISKSSANTKRLFTLERGGGGWDDRKVCCCFHHEKPSSYNQSALLESRSCNIGGNLKEGSCNTKGKKKRKQVRWNRRLPLTNHHQRRSGISVLKSLRSQNVSGYKIHTYNGLTALFYSSFIIRIAEVFGVQERLTNISMTNRLGFPITQLISMRLCLTLTVFFLFIWRKFGEA